MLIDDPVIELSHIFVDLILYGSGRYSTFNHCRRFFGRLLLLSILIEITNLLGPAHDQISGALNWGEHTSSCLILPILLLQVICSACLTCVHIFYLLCRHLSTCSRFPRRFRRLHRLTRPTVVTALLSPPTPFLIRLRLSQPRICCYSLPPRS